MKRILVGVVLVLLVATMLASDVQAAKPTAIKLFDAQLTKASPYPTGAIYLFNSITVDIELQPGVKAFISSTPEGDGSFIVDNAIHVNDWPICLPLYQSCFTDFLGGLPTGVPIETVLLPVPAMDVTQYLVNGENLFELYDIGGIYGNTDIYLVFVKDSKFQKTKGPK